MGLKLIIYPLSFTATLAIIFMLILPTRKEIKQIKEVDIAAAQAKLDQELEITRNINNLSENYALYEDDVRTLQYALPADDDLKSFLTQIETILLNNNIFYEAVTPAEEPNNMGYVDPTMDGQTFRLDPPQKINVQLTLTGNYEDVIKALEELENLNRVNNVTRIVLGTDDTVAAATEEGEAATAVTTGQVTVETTVEIYKQPALDATAIRRVFQSAWQAADATPAEGEEEVMADMAVEEL